MRKKFFTLLLAMVFMLTLPFAGSNVNSYAATSKTADQAIAWVQAQVGKAIDYDGAYGAQCVDLAMAYYNALGVTPSSGNGKDYATNTLPAGWTRVQGGTPQKGDILVYGASNSNPYGHVAIYESARVTYHQNFGSAQYVQKVTNISYNGFDNPYWGYIRPNWTNSGDTQAPSITKVSVHGIDSTGYWVTCTVTDNVGVDRVQFPTWLASGTSDGCPWPVGSHIGNEWSCRISYSTFGGSRGPYNTHIYAYDTSGNYSAYMVNYANEDKEKPVITDAKVYGIDDTGYWVSCKVTDNIGVETVKFPTWLASGTSDGCPWPVGSQSGTTWKCRINYSTFGGSEGPYHTHIYAYDYMGNSAYLMLHFANCKHATTEVRNAKAATCTAKGYTGDTYCKICGTKIKTGTEIAATGHEWGTGIVIKEPTTTTTGVMQYTCTKCGSTMNETIAKLKEPLSVKSLWASQHSVGKVKFKWTRKDGVTANKWDLKYRTRKIGAGGSWSGWTTKTYTFGVNDGEMQAWIDIPRNYVIEIHAQAQGDGTWSTGIITTPAGGTYQAMKTVYVKNVATGEHIGDTIVLKKGETIRVRPDYLYPVANYNARPRLYPNHMLYDIGDKSIILIIKPDGSDYTAGMIDGVATIKGMKNGTTQLIFRAPNGRTQVTTVIVE